MRTNGDFFSIFFSLGVEFQVKTFVSHSKFNKTYNSSQGFFVCVVLVINSKRHHLYFCVYFDKFPWNILLLTLGIKGCPLFSLLTFRSASDFDAHYCSDEKPSIRRIWSLTRELIRNVLFAWHLCCLKTPWNAIFFATKKRLWCIPPWTHTVIPQERILMVAIKQSNTVSANLLIFHTFRKP